MRRFILALPLLNGCDVTGPHLPPGAEQFVPPAVYQQWWNLTQECSGLTASFNDVTWYRVPGAADIPLGDGSSVNGRWDATGNRIILAGDSELHGDLVRHEMLHALLRHASHPRSAFIGRCSGTVVCIEECITDGGAAALPDPAAQVVSPSTLQIGVEVSPSAPASSVNSGTFMMVVTAKNTLAHPVIVQLPPSGDPGPSVSFGYLIEAGSRTTWYTVRAEVPEATRFAAFEVKRFIFDFRIGEGGTRYDQPPGTFRFNGAYGEVWAPNPPIVTVAP